MPELQLPPPNLQDRVSGPGAPPPPPLGPAELAGAVHMLPADGQLPMPEGSPLEGGAGLRSDALVDAARATRVETISRVGGSDFLRGFVGGLIQVADFGGYGRAARSVARFGGRIGDGVRDRIAARRSAGQSAGSNLN